MIILCFVLFVSASVAQETPQFHAVEDLIEATHLIHNAMSHLNSSAPPPSECKKESAKPVDCEDILRSGKKENGKYTIYPRIIVQNQTSMEVYCDMTTDGGGWTVIQRRGNFGRPADYFYQDWAAYKAGFGDIEKDFWLGNDKIFALTNQRMYSARFDLGDWERNTRYAQYDNFWIDDEQQSYRLTVQGYNGTAGDSLINTHNGMRFTTRDRDNDNHRDNCAHLMRGAWWYRSCHSSNLNGLYYQNGRYNQDNANGIDWSTWRGYRYSLMLTEVKIRPKYHNMTASS